MYVVSDCEAEPAPAAAGGREQRALQARGDPLLGHRGFLAHQHLDLVPPLERRTSLSLPKHWKPKQLLVTGATVTTQSESPASSQVDRREPHRQNVTFILGFHQ